MRRLPVLFLVLGATCVMAAVAVWDAGSGRGPVADAAMLPEDHPPLANLPVSTTPADFWLPGTQPNMLEDDMVPPNICVGCHMFYGDEETNSTAREEETWRAWSGSMMAQAGRDPVFWAALDIAVADADHAGDFCLRCHLPTAHLNDDIPANPSLEHYTSGSADLDQLEGIQCSICHRMVDPEYEDGISPDRDLVVLDDLADAGATVTRSETGSYIVDTLDERRGPFLLQDDWVDLGGNPHGAVGLDWPLQSPYHQESALCGTCHDITNPAFTWDETVGEYVLNDLDTPSDLVDGFPVERTYSEWLLSDYNTATGVYAPEFGGNKTFVSTCQDCHMRDITAAGGAVGGAFVVRDDMPLHDLTGANTWVPQTLPLHPNPVISGAFSAEGDPFLGNDRLEAIEDGIERARYMLQNAAELSATVDGDHLTVRVTNNSGHKLPTGYVEGRRMWLQIEGYDMGGNLVYVSGAYDVATGVLTPDDDLMVYESHHGITESLANEVGLPAGESFHFVLNNIVLKDNRIPPRGYTFAAFDAVDAAPMTDGVPDPTRYADGQYWDDVVYDLSDTGAVRGVVRLLFQVSSKEYIEFLRDNNPNPSSEGNLNNGDILFSLWEQTERSKPEVMAEVNFNVAPMYDIGGIIVDDDGAPLLGVQVSNGMATTVTAADGTYLFTDLISGTYQITPTLANYTFDPVSRTVELPPNEDSADFVGMRYLWDVFLPAALTE